MFQYDIFLSHSARDFREVDEVRSTLLKANFSVYCDRYDDKLLDRSKVTSTTANTLKDRMRRCNAMVFVVTQNSSGSRWMPWELGFFDGVRGKVLVYPVDDDALAAANQQEYLSLFKILKPGSLPQQLKPEVQGIDGIIGVLRDRPLFAPADQAITVDYAKRFAQIHPLDFAMIGQVQNEIWQAWLRLWGIGR
jgi:TIR domain